RNKSPRSFETLMASSRAPGRRSGFSGGASRATARGERDARRRARFARTGASPEAALRLTVVLVCFFVSGATALVYEVVWLRMIGLVFGHTVHAITTVLTAFMAGLGLGSVFFGRRAARFLEPIRIYGLLELGIGLSCALVPILIWLASFVYLRLY